MELMTKQALMTALKVLGVVVLLLVAFYATDWYFGDRAEQQKVQEIKDQLRVSEENSLKLLARSDVPGYWLYIVDRDFVVLSGERSEVAKATVGEVVFTAQQSKANALSIFKDYFIKNGWKIGTDDLKLGKLSFSKDDIGQLVFILVEEINAQTSKVSIKRIVAHE